MEEMTEANRSQGTLVFIEADLMVIAVKFLKHRTEDISSINIALQQADFLTVMRLGHNLKGAGASYGFSYLSVLGNHLEQAAQNQQPEAIQQTVRALQTYLDCVELAPI